MGKRKYALLDTDFISKLYRTQKDENNRWIDRILELSEYQFVCHEQIITELKEYNREIVNWLQENIAEGRIQKFSDQELVAFLRSIYGKNAVLWYLFYLENACSLFDRSFYNQYYAGLEQKTEEWEADFLEEVSRCDATIGKDCNLGEIKTYLLQQILQNQEKIQLYIFCSDDKKARNALAYAGGIPCISALSSFYVGKERLAIGREEAKLYFDSWMSLHQKKGQTSFKVHKNEKGIPLAKIDGYEIFERIYDGRMTLLKNGNLKLQGEDHAPL